MLGSMMRSVLILISMLHVSAYLWASNLSDNEPDIEKTLILRDTLKYKRVNERPRSFNFSFTFPQNKSTFLWDFGKNAEEIERLNQVVNDIRTNELIIVRHILLAGYSSMEGIFDTNSQLAKDRMTNVRDYLEKKYRLWRDYPFYVNSGGEDWQGLREKILYSGMYRKKEMLEILDSNESAETRKRLLMELDGGTPYEILFTEVFPSLRRVDLTLEYDLYKLMEKCNPCDGYSREEVDDMLRKERMAMVAEFAKVLTSNTHIVSNSQVTTEKPETRIVREEPKSAEVMYVKPHKPQRHRKGEFHPLIGVKTNLFSWAGMTPEFEHKTFMPNLAIEFFFLPKWSVQATGTYAYWDYGKEGEFWGLSGYGVEPRFWPIGNSKPQKFYIGAFGLSGDYDIRQLSKEVAGTDNYTGRYWQGGLSAGYYLPISDHFGLEFGLRGGYQSSKSKVYEKRDPDNIYQYSLNETRWGIMEVNVSLSFRFGKRK